MLRKTAKPTAKPATAKATTKLKRGNKLLQASSVPNLK